MIFLKPATSDSARYKAPGDSVVIPCVEFVLRRLSEKGQAHLDRIQVQMATARKFLIMVMPED